MLDAYTTAFFIADPKTRRLDLAASQSLSKFLDESASLPIEQSGILSQVQKIGQTIHLDKLNMQEVSSALPFYRPGESLLKGLFATSVGNGAGVLYVDTKHTWGFSDKQQKCIREAADVLNELLGQQECVEQQKSYARILELWYTIDQAACKDYSLEEYSQAIVDACSRFLGTEYAFMAVKEPQDLCCRLMAQTSTMPRNLQNQSFSTERGLIGWIFHNKKSLSISKLNPESPDHFLIFPGENLPHQGAFWGIPTQLSLGHLLVLTFLDRRPLQWSSDDQYAITRILHTFHLVFEQLYWKERYEQLQAYDLSTKLYNAIAFEQWVETTLAASMRSNTPFTLAVIQFEPWHTLYTRMPPKEIRRRRRALAAEISEILPSQVVIGRIGENRFGLLFPDAASKDAERYLHHVTNTAHYKSIGNLGKTKMKIYVGWAAFPHDGAACEELWSLVHNRLFESTHSFSEKKIKNIDR
jgi:GGDEF domain-containing protein